LACRCRCIWLPRVDAGFADAVLAALLDNRHAALVLLQDADDLLLAETTAFHVLVLSMGRNELQTGLGARGNVMSNKVFELSPSRCAKHHGLAWSIALNARIPLLP
jgi:hypothetical protein